MNLLISKLGVHDALREGMNGVAPIYLAQPITYADSIAILETVGKPTGRTDEARLLVMRS
ncbi:hypothetical protein AB4Z29_01880 [Paenibacillus sp. 2TAB23]|uniref:hypothetical protein n=1 Tax=Paenibacillus sp. 2TAB23 TaxID=3233004 RepID=UPI003F9E140E